MASFYSLFIVSWICTILTAQDVDLKPMELNPILYPPFECYNSPLRIGKQTLATTDSYRDTEMIQLIFPEAKLEYIPHFHQDECARASKLYLPYTCFKLHAPQTWELEEGYLSVKTLETEYTKKFYALINGYSSFNFDAFLDNNIAFWVLDLDKYLLQINDNHHILQHYVGLKWYHDAVQKTFYSLLIQSPGSQRVIELISFNKPVLSLYEHLRADFHWRETRIPRASFRQYPEGEYPWTGFVGTLYELGAPLLPDIVPIRISYACIDIAKHIDFYTQIMEATLLEAQYNVVDKLDDISVSYAFLQPFGDSYIEIQYIERPADYTYGAFTIEQYASLLTETHEDRISDVYCGVDRWFDNHYGYDTSVFYEIDNKFMDRVFFKLVNGDSKYRVYYIDHQRDEAWVNSDSFDIDQVDDLHGVEYKLFVFDANGQTIQMIGYFMDIFIEDSPPIYNKQWCATACPHNQDMGRFKIDKVYKEDVEDVVYQIVISEDGEALIADTSTVDIQAKKEMLEKWLIIIIPVAFIVFSTIIFCIYRCCAMMNMNSNRECDPEKQCLLEKQ